MISDLGIVLSSLCFIHLPVFNDLACCSSFSWSSLIRLGSCVWYQERKTLLLCNLQNCNSLSLDLNMAKPIQLCFIPIHLCQRYSKSHLQGFDKLIVEFIKLWYIRQPCYRGWCLYKYWMTLVLLFHAFNSWGNLSGESSQFLRTEKLTQMSIALHLRVDYIPIQYILRKIHFYNLRLIICYATGCHGWELW